MFRFSKLHDGVAYSPLDVSDGGLSREVQTIALRKEDWGGELRDVKIRLVHTGDRIRAATDLINERYRWRGYGQDHRLSSDANHLTFIAEASGEVVGTITLAINSQNGLAADRTFFDEVDQFRSQPDAKVCELTKFAFSAEVQSKKLMATLFHIVFVYGHRTFGCTDLLIEVHPRHARFYQAMLGFRRVGSVTENQSVSAPAQLMALRVSDIRDEINYAATSPAGSRARSLYSRFFSPAEESGIYQRLFSAEAISIPYKGDIAKPGLSARRQENRPAFPKRRKLQKA